MAAFSPSSLASLPAPYICPVCGGELLMQPSGKSYACAARHNFDLAREGYLNLLPVQHKHSLEPGDSKDMLRARREFLEAGFYEPLAAAALRLIEAAPRPPDRSLRLLDLGCGEGDYSRFVAGHCREPGRIAVHGIDIAKHAVAAAARRQPVAAFAVASVHRLPYPDGYFDFVLRIFAPAAPAELRRVLAPVGMLLAVTPGPGHLRQLKRLIYAEAKEHPAADEAPDGFACLSAERLEYRITPAPAQRLALLQMTPFAWHAGPEVGAALAGADEFAVDLDFVLTLYQRR